MGTKRRVLFSAITALALLVPGAGAMAGTSSPPLAAGPPAPAAAPTPVTNLPIVAVALTDPDPTKNTLDYLNADKDNSVKATVNLVDGSNSGNDIVDAPATIKGRGNYTWTLDKKPYQIKFTTAFSVLGMESSRTWVLLANHTDPSLLRNKIAYDLADEFGLEYSPQSRFVDLTVNGEYLGNYLLTEKTEVGTNRVELTDDKGVLLELDYIHGTAEPHYFYTNLTKTLFVLKDATLGVDDVLDPTVAQAYQEIQDDLNELETALYADTPDWQEISSLIDVDSFAKYGFLHELTENYDFNRSSVYFYKDGPNDKLHAGPAWDFDASQGNYTTADWGGDPTYEYVKATTYIRNKRHNWFETLMRNKQFVTMTNTLYSSRFRAAIDSVPARIDALKSEIAQSAKLNFERWEGSRGYDATSFDTGVVNYKNWFSQRTAYLRQAYGDAVPILSFTAHLANLGWRPPVTSGMIAGTTGELRRLEALRLLVSNTGFTGGVQGNGHVQNIGWTGWQAPGAVIGTTGKALRLEAVQLRLTDQLAAHFDLSYRVHVQNIGWMGWVKNGQTAGTTGRALRIEAIQVRLLDKAPSVKYRAHVQNIGWMSYVSDGAISGTTGRALRLEALQLASLAHKPLGGNIEYRSYVQNDGWMDWTSPPGVTGTTGQALRLEALEIRLTGDLAEHYSVRYSTHVQDVGWQPWVYDGATAGKAASGKRVEAVKIQIVPKAY